MKPKYILLICMTLLLSSCNTQPKQITNQDDYDNYLELAENKTLQNVKEDVDFWKKKLVSQPNQFPYIAKLAASYSHLFQITGQIEYLIEAEQQLILVNEMTQYSSPSYLKLLASNYISQHKFKQALEQLNKAEAIGDQLLGTQKMLFDVHLELGNYDLAKAYMIKFKNFNDFDYLIRLSKWSDHIGNLDLAIKYMEQAKKIAEKSNLPDIKQWAYTNLADFYGHAGQIQESYIHYLKALELDPNDAYAKKGIAWIVYSYEKNPNEALTILNSITDSFFAPDYYLLKAEIAEFKGDNTLKDEQLQLYEMAMKNKLYGDMYNAYNVILTAENYETVNDAITMAKLEVAHRPTPQSYDLLAWAYFNNGNLVDALQIVETHIIDKTFEPIVLYHVAEIYKATGKIELLEPIKQELLASIYELGPIMKEKIDRL